MRQMTLRDIPDEVEMVARSEASKQGVSLNKAFLALLRKGSQQVIAQSPAMAMQHGLVLIAADKQFLILPQIVSEIVCK